MSRTSPILPAAALALACFLSHAQTSAPVVEKLTLETGLRSIVRFEPGSRTLAICVFIGAGVEEDGNRPGIGALVSRAIFGNNQNLTREEVRNSIFDVGGSLETDWNADYTLITCVTSPDRMEDALYVISQALKGAQFDHASLEAARTEVLAAIGTKGQDSYEAAYAALRQRMYRESSYREPFGGTEASVKRLTAEHARRFYDRNYTPGNTVIAVAGNVKGPRVRRALENSFDDYTKPDTAKQKVRGPELLLESGAISRYQPTHTATLLAGFAGPGLAHPDFAAWNLLSAVVGGGKSSRLWRAVRDTAGIGYVVRSTTPPLLRNSPLTLHLEYDPARPGVDGAALDPKAAGELMIKTARTVIDRPPSDSEIDRAKSYTLGGYALAHQRARDRAFHLGWYEILGLGYEYDGDFPTRIASVSSDQIKGVAAKYLGQHILVTLMPARR